MQSGVWHMLGGAARVARCCSGLYRRRLDASCLHASSVFSARKVTRRGSPRPIRPPGQIWSKRPWDLSYAIKEELSQLFSHKAFPLPPPFLVHVIHFWRRPDIVYTVVNLSWGVCVVCRIFGQLWCGVFFRGSGWRNGWSRRLWRN